MYSLLLLGSTWFLFDARFCVIYIIFFASTQVLKVSYSSALVNGVFRNDFLEDCLFFLASVLVMKLSFVCI